MASKGLTIEQQQERENDKDPVTKWMVIIICVLGAILLIKNIWFRDFNFYLSDLFK